MTGPLSAHTFNPHLYDYGVRCLAQYKQYALLRGPQKRQQTGTARAEVGDRTARCEPRYDDLSVVLLQAGHDLSRHTGRLESPEGPDV